MNDRLTLNNDTKIGIVNRGEAAVRFINALKEYNTEFEANLSAVAFHLDSESRALFVKESHFSYYLNSFPGFSEITAASPYLDGAFIVNALKKAECKAVWVGWGFLAEDPAFAKLLEDNDILLLGPTSSSMKLLGDKIQAKELADREKVPTVPWSKGMVRDSDHAIEMARSIGYPVILKSAYGGGGRGIRKVYAEEEIATAFETTSDEIERFFGDRTLFMEALVVRGRHLEVQCLADYHGNVKTFSVRDCSVQRNNQKIIEETPPPGLSADILANLESHSVSLLKGAKYQGAATVEFLYDLDRSQGFFMEVNTRLQVEHPITESLFLVDLVRGQIEVGMGRSIEEYHHSPRGHVMELRLNSEDPAKNFLPTPGRVITFAPPNIPGIRIDSGIETGSVITSDFDSMCAKIIAHGSNRKNTIAKLQRALANLKIEIENGTTNQGFALEILADPDFQKGGVDTGYIERFLKKNTHNKMTNWDVAAVATAIYQYRQNYNEDFQNLRAKLNRHSIPRNIPEQSNEFAIQLQGNRYEFQVRSLGSRFYHVRVDGVTICVEYVKWGKEFILKTNIQKHKVQLVERNETIQCEVDGFPYQLELDDGGIISAPSPSVVLTVEAKEGRKIKKGGLLLTLEAMKMEIAVTAKEDMVVTKVGVKAGEKVEAGQPLIEMEKLTIDDKQDSTPKAPRISFERLALSKDSDTPSLVEAHWNYLRREYLSIFKGFDFNGEQTITLQLEAFVDKNKDYEGKLVSLIAESCRCFTNIHNLIQPKSSKSSDALDYLTHYFLREEDREKGLPEDFLESLKKSLAMYLITTARFDVTFQKAVFHILKAHNNRDASSQLLTEALFSLQKYYNRHQGTISPAEMGDVLDQLANLKQKNPKLLDATVHTRYELIDKFAIKKALQNRQDVVNQLLDSAIDEAEEEAIDAVVESGHQVINYLLEQKDLDIAKKKRRLELIAKRFNRDRTIVEEIPVESEIPVHALRLRHRKGELIQSVMILSEAQFMQPLDWLKSIHERIIEAKGESIILVKKAPDSQPAILLEHLEGSDIGVDLATMGICADNQVTYYSFGKKNGKWQELERRRKFSPLRYRELKVERLDQFDIELLYHTHFVHVLKLTGKENPKDQRLFALVEIPEADFEVVDTKVQSIKNFQYSIYEAVQAIRLHQAAKRRYHWNRIIVHIGQTHPITFEQIDQYPKNVINLVSGVGLEKIVIYTKIAGKRRKAIDAEVLVENFDTKYTIKARRPSPTLLAPQSQYVTKVIRSARSGNPYPYQIVRMLTDASSPFPRGEFVEYDIDESKGNFIPTPIRNRPYGQNPSNVVFGIIENTVKGESTYTRVLILGDPSKDLGSLAEKECRRVLAAIDLAEEKGIPIEWIPVSSGAAIGMDTGTENLDWTAQVLKRIVDFTQKGGEINIIVAGINVGAQSYWNAEATMLMHTNGLLIMTRYGSMVLTGKKALDFSGSVSGEDNIDIGGAKKIMGINGQAQIVAENFEVAYQILFQHYSFTYRNTKSKEPIKRKTSDDVSRDVTTEPYTDHLKQGFDTIGDILGTTKNKERKKPFDLRQVMYAVKDNDVGYLERWQSARGAESAIVWETSIGGYGVGMIGIDSQSLVRLGEIPNDGPDAWNGGTLYPLSSKKIARAINAFSGKVPTVVMANISGFDGSPESLRKLQLEYGAEIGRAVVNFKGPIVFVVLARYHGGAYVVFSKSLNPNMKVLALEGTFASVIGGAPAAAVVFPRLVDKETGADPEVTQAKQDLQAHKISPQEFNELRRTVRLTKQADVASRFEQIHSVERALSVGSLDKIIKPEDLRQSIVEALEESF